MGRRSFSFNLPDGMCPECEGTGKVSAIDASARRPRADLDDGAITVPNFTPAGGTGGSTPSPGSDPDGAARLRGAVARFMYTPPTKVKALGMNTNYEGLVVKVKRLFLDKEKESSQAHVKAFVERIATFTACPAAAARDWTRLRARRRAGAHLPECCAMQISDLATVAGSLDDLARWRSRSAGARLRWSTCWARSSRSVWATSRSTASRAPCPAARRSGSRWCATSGRALTDITYVFDEPTIGLHPHDMPG